jgi:hypothetical protein
LPIQKVSPPKQPVAPVRFYLLNAAHLSLDKELVERPSGDLSIDQLSN